MKKILFAIFTMVLLSACGSTLPPEVLAALTKVETVDKDANTFVMKGDWVCNSAAKDCEIRVPMGGNTQNASTEKMRMLLSYYDNQDTALDYFRIFTPFLNQGLSIWDNNRRDKRNNDYLLKQLDVQSKEKISLYDMLGGISSNSTNATTDIAKAGFEGITQIANSNSQLFEFMPPGGDTISNHYVYEYNDAFNQYADSFNPATTNQALQPIDWGGLSSFAGVFQPEAVPVVATEDPVE